MQPAAYFTVRWEQKILVRLRATQVPRKVVRECKAIRTCIHLCLSEKDCHFQECLEQGMNHSRIILNENEEGLYADKVVCHGPRAEDFADDGYAVIKSLA